MNSLKSLSAYISSYLQYNVTCKNDLIEHLNRYVTSGIIDKEEHSMIADVLDFSTMRARDVMIPRAQIVSLDANSATKEHIAIMQANKHSRYPVIDKNIDNIKGILLAKDYLLQTHNQTKKNISLDTLMRTASFIPESTRLDSLLKHFQSSHNHMAIVVDEYGAVSGIVTIEDVIEEITGEIEDEHDQAHEQHYFKKIYAGCYHVDALTPIEEFNSFFSLELPDDYFDTIGGIIAQKFGRVPKAGDSCHINHLTIHILHATNKKIKSIEVVVTNQKTNTSK